MHVEVVVSEVLSPPGIQDATKERPVHYHMMTSKKAANLVTKLPHGSNHLSTPNTFIYGFKAGLQPIIYIHI